MRVHRWAVLVSVVVLQVACGGRAIPASSSRDGAPPNHDHTRLFDLPRPVPDRPVLLKPDQPNASCLPLPASQIADAHVGSWKGTWTCPGEPTNWEGIMDLKLAISGPTSFTVSGYMKGYSYWIGDASGTMVCTSLNATIPNLKIGNNSMTPYKAVAVLEAQLSLSSAGKPLLVGTWQAKATDVSCFGSGSWSTGSN